MDELTITEADLRGWDPCYGEELLVEALEGVTFPISARQILALDGIPADDLLWVVLRPELLTDRVRREFACDCAERAMGQHGNGDPRSLAAIAVARRFAAGDATEAELDAAGDAAGDAARAAARAAGGAAGAARAAARAAAEAAARAAAGDAEYEWQVARLAEALGHG